MKLLLLSMLPFAWGAPCIQIDRDRILAADLPADAAAFLRLDPGLVIAPSPMPGVRRTFSTRELAALANRGSLPPPALIAGVCFERALAPLTEDRIRAAMASSLREGGARIEILDYSRQPFPSGELAFPLANLRPPANRSNSPAFWRGSVKYGPRRTIGVWASVRITETRSVVLAAREIHAGSVVVSDDLAIAPRDVFPFAPRLETAADALGRMARKSIPEGSLLSEALLEIPPDIAAGEIVHVVAGVGAARITFDAVARSSGRKGDPIVLVNPESHRTFRALVDEKLRAHISAGT